MPEELRVYLGEYGGGIEGSVELVLVRVDTPDDDDDDDGDKDDDDRVQVPVGASPYKDRLSALQGVHQISELPPKPLADCVTQQAPAAPHRRSTAGGS